MATALADRPDTRRRSGASVATRIKIMEAAERLFADRGIDGVALREIAVAAEQGNNTAVQYHFGTKEQLVFAIFEHRSRLFEPMRADMLARADAAGLLMDAKILLEIMCLPHLSIADADGRHPYSAFLGQYLTRGNTPALAHPFDDPNTPVPALRRVRRLIVERVPYVPADLLRLRIGLCKLMFLNMLIRRDNGSPHQAQNLPLEVLVDDTLEQMTAALIAPFHPARPELFALPQPSGH